MRRKRLGRSAALVAVSVAHLGLLYWGSASLLGDVPTAAGAGSARTTTVTLFGAGVLMPDATAVESGSDSATVEPTMATNEETLSLDDAPLEGATASGAEAPATATPPSVSSSSAGGSNVASASRSGSPSSPRGGVDNPWSRASILTPHPTANLPAEGIRAQALRCWRGQPARRGLKMRVVLDDAGALVGAPVPVQKQNAEESVGGRELAAEASRALAACAPYAVVAARGQREVHDIAFADP